MRIVALAALAVLAGCGESHADRDTRVISEGQSFCRKAGISDGHPKWMECVLGIAQIRRETAEREDAEQSNRAAAALGVMAVGMNNVSNSYNARAAYQPPVYQPPVVTRCTPSSGSVTCTSY